MKMNDNLQIEPFYDWLKFSQEQIPPGCLDHIDTKAPIKWELRCIEPFGRCMVAKEDIKEGEQLFVDYPVITGPKQNGEPLCLGCYKQLDPNEPEYKCSRCGWFVCNSECETRGYHPLECEVFAASENKPDPEEIGDGQYAYEPILPLRCLMLKNHSPKKWETLRAMESHDSLRKGSELWQTEQKNVCDFLKSKTNISETEEEIHSVTGILDINCHEVRSNLPNSKDEYRVRGLYPLTAMMSHDCFSNTHHTVMDDRIMLVIASRNIPKGQQLTSSYTHLLSGTIERRKHLKYGKFFDCVCNRCKDPTELGTYFSALQCSKNKCGGNIIPANPTVATNMPDFQCDKCGFEVKCGIVNRLTNIIYLELQKIPENDLLELEMILRKYQGVLHPNHFHNIGIKHTLSQLYGRIEGYKISDLSAKQLQRKIDCCKDLLVILETLDPGISRLRGITYYELHAPILLRANRSFQDKKIVKKDFLDTLEQCQAMLKKTIYCLQFEPLFSFEGDICKIARSSSKELGKWITTVKSLPASDFLQHSDKQLDLSQTNSADMSLENLLKVIQEN